MNRATFKFIPLSILAIAGVFGQATTNVTLTPKQDGSTGTVKYREKYVNGTNAITHRAPDSITSDYTITDPSSPPTANQCAVYNGTAFVYRSCNNPDKLPADYNFSVAPGGSLSIGTNTVTFTPCPLGAAGTDVHHGVRISGGTGTAETVKITGGTCTYGATTGTLQFTAANTHTGAFTLASNSGGVQEAINAAIASSGRVLIPLGQIALGPAAPSEDGIIYISGPVTVAGGDNSINGGSELYVTTNTFAMVVGTGAGGSYPVNLSNFVIQGSGMASGGGIQFTADATHNCYSAVQDMQFYTLPIGVDFKKGCVAQIHRNFFYAYTDTGLLIRNLYDPDVGDHSITSNEFLVIGAGGIGTRAILWTTGGGAKIIGNKFNTQGKGIDMDMTDPSIIVIVSDNSFDNQTEFSFRARGTTGWLGITVTGNIITGAGGAGYIAFDIGDDTADAISNVVISGNSMQAAGAASTAIKIGDVENVYIGENVIGVFTKAIDLKAAATNVTIGKHSIYGSSIALTYAAISSIRSNSINISSGYLGYASSSTNTKIIHTFQPPATGEVNNAVIFGTNTTGAISQRGLSWDTTAKMSFSRFPSAGVTAEQADVDIDASGFMVSNYGIGVFKTPTDGVGVDVDGIIRAAQYFTKANCSDNAGAAACGAAIAGSFVIGVGLTTVAVSTTKVTADSQILITNDPSLATRLGVTCNTNYVNDFVLSRTAGANFVVQTSAAPVTNPRCYSYFIIN